MGIGTAVGIGAGALSSGIAAHEANNASNAQVSAANNAAALQKQSADEALAFQKQQFATEQQNQAPWLASGTQALSQLQSMAPFQGPGTDFTQDPGYQFRVSQGQKAIQNSAAARGGVLSGGTLKGISDYTSGAASDEYNNAYNRSLQTYDTNQNALLARAGLGQNATSQINNAASATGANVGSTLLQSGAQQAQDLQNAGAARASGYASTGNILSNGINGNVNNYLSYMQLRNMFPPGSTMSSGYPMGGYQEGA
jgi:hypothetical protein